jgi:hypothetical protein
MSGIFAKLGFNFDTNKFGDGQYLSPQAKAYLNAAPIQLSSWQQSDIANGNVQTTNYYKNPLANDLIILTNTSNSVIKFANTVPFDFGNGSNASLEYASNVLEVQLKEFKKHTDNVSGVTLLTSNTDTIPSFESASSIGNFLLRIVSYTDDIQNTTPLLGSMTSLFVGPEINANVIVVTSANTLLNNSVAPNGNCYLSESQVLSISNSFNVLSSFISYRRTSDWNFFANATVIVLDTMKVSSFNNLGNTQLYLINNLIGTDTLKTNLANTGNTII